MSRASRSVVAVAAAAALIVVASALAALLASASEYKKEVVLLGTNFPNRISIVVDHSGSMAYGFTDPRPYAVAVGEAMWVAEQAGDDGEVRFYGFCDYVDEEPQGWIELPDAAATAAAKKWLEERTPNGGTSLVAALERALSDKVDPLGVVVVTDGDPDGPSIEEAKQIVKMNRERKPNPATIGVVAIDPSGKKEDRFGFIVSKAGEGGYVRVVTKK